MKSLNKEFDLTGRNIIVTGAGGLLGSVFSDALSEAGAQVYLIDKNERKLKKSFKSLRNNGYKPVNFTCDVTSPEEIDKVVEEIHNLGSIDGLVNSAAIDPKVDAISVAEAGDNGWFTTYSLENWSKSLSVNLTGTFLMTQAVCRVMENQDGGRGAVVNLSSTYGIVAPDQRIYEDKKEKRFFKPVDYSVTKAGILGFTRAVAAFYRDTNLRVNALTPGGVFHGHDSEFVSRYAGSTIVGRMSKPDEYRGAIVFLCSDASSYMTGSNLVIDGGWTAI